MAPTYILNYFPAKAVGEPIRFLLKYGEIDFEDRRIPFDVWPELKDKMPFGQIPVLEIDGKIGHQSIAVCRYLAKQFELVGNDDWENLEIDAMVDTLGDVRSKMILYNYEKDEVVKESRREPLFNDQLPFYLGRLEEVAKANNGHLAVNRLTWADFFFAANIDYFNGMAKQNLFVKYPNLQAVADKVKAIPSIKKWVEERPKTDL